MSAPTQKRTDTVSTGGCPVDHHGYEPFDMNDPFSAYARLRSTEPVMFDERIGCWVVTRYDDIKTVFDNWEIFSSENAQAPVRERGPQAKQIMNDGGFTAYSGLSARRPPEHTRIRKATSKAFTPRRYKALEPFIRANVDQQLRALLAHEDRRGDLLRDLAYDVPTVTILTLIGADTSQVDQYKRWSDSRAAMTWGNLSDEQQIPHAHNLVEYWQECQRLVADAHEHGGDNLVADLVRAQQEGTEITDHEIASVCYSLLFAGHETTTTLISNTLRLLLAHRDQWEALREDPKKIPKAVEEVLRYSPSIVAWRRKALEDTMIGETPIPAGSEILLVMGSANRDESQFADPETFDITRDNAREHLAFGFGLHYCLGNMLAKLQTRIVVEEVLKTAPFLELVDPDAITFGENLSFRAPTSVPVRWNAPGENATDTDETPEISQARYIQFFDSPEAPQHDQLGGKCASLVSLTAAGMPVPPGFALTTVLYDDFIATAGIADEIHELLAGLDPEDVTRVDEISTRIRDAITSRAVPEPLRRLTIDAYERLQSRFDHPVPVAVRSSATAEDLPDASFAGQQDTYLWLNGIDEVLEHIRRCWASLYTSRAITYRLKNNIPDEGLSMAVAVQKMVSAKVAGVAMTMDPTNGDRSKITVDASYGVGEMVVSGQVTPDNIVLDKVMLTVVSETIGDKHAELVPDPVSHRLVERDVDADRRACRSLNDEELKAVAAIAKRAEKHYGCPQDIEWALDADLPDGQNLLLLQSRPETVWSAKPAQDKATEAGKPARRTFDMSSISRAMTKPRSA
ncbi:cytochrome P450 [Prescottella agglutinans]|uniref:Cytochrome P450 n=1 Tax=Prescottella agglutinans TaxID=1644129 RepID=A0ABT6M637_9NOCA|nr:cytochrome P450 [Prescottella agglutinans]